jgi:aquaporin Z
MTAALRKHWPEYLMEAAGLGAFMISACTFAVLLEHPASPLRAALPNATARRACMGLAMGLTAAAIVYSPWGRQSGAHLNPSVTLAFLTLRRIPRVDAAFYAGAQVVGAALGVLAAWALLGARLSHPAAHFALTAPGRGGALLAFGAEAAISFVLMTVVLHVSGSRHARLTGICAAALVALYILVEAPISGMSMNPARSLASALAARHFGSLWIYFTAPPLGMVLAAILYARRDQRGCAKLVHATDSRCIFCEERAARPAGGRA